MVYLVCFAQKFLNKTLSKVKRFQLPVLYNIIILNCSDVTSRRHVWLKSHDLVFQEHCNTCKGSRASFSLQWPREPICLVIN